MESFGGRFGYQLTQTSDHEGRILDGLGHHFEWRPLHIFQRSLHHAGARDTHVNRRVTLGDAMERTGHERVVLYSVAKFHQLRASVSVLVLRELGGFLHHFTHALHRVHIDACLRGAHSHRAADAAGRCQSFGDGVDEFLIGRRHAAIHQSGEAAQDVHAYRVSRALQRFRNRHIGSRREAPCHQGNRSHRNAAIDDGHAVLSGNIMAHFGQVLCLLADGVINFIAQDLLIIGHAAQKRDPHGDGAHVQFILVKHALGF